MTSTLFAPFDDTADEADDFQAIYQHAKRPEWGVAILAWERGDKRGYQFDDGTLRIFKKGFYGLLEEVDPPEGLASDLIIELNRRLHDSLEQKGKARPQRPLGPAYPFDDQVGIFTKLYPGGFEDPRWARGVRGIGAGKRLKRHREPAIREAGELLAKERLDDLVAREQYSEVCNAALMVLDGTNLVGRAQIEALRPVDALRQRQVAVGLADLLYGELPHGQRFTNFVRALNAASNKEPSWRMATALPALVKPNQHVCVRPSTFIKQAGELAPNLSYLKKPQRKSYRNYKKVAKAARRHLIDAGFEPRDYLDIHDFIWETLRPAAAKYLS